MKSKDGYEPLKKNSDGKGLLKKKGQDVGINHLTDGYPGVHQPISATFKFMVVTRLHNLPTKHNISSLIK